jgi:hypothetical protein
MLWPTRIFLAGFILILVGVLGSVLWAWSSGGDPFDSVEVVATFPLPETSRTVLVFKWRYADSSSDFIGISDVASDNALTVGSRDGRVRRHLIAVWTGKPEQLSFSTSADLQKLVLIPSFGDGETINLGAFQDCLYLRFRGNSPALCFKPDRVAISVSTQVLR